MSELSPDIAFTDIRTLCSPEQLNLEITNEYTENTKLNEVEEKPVCRYCLE